MKLVIYLLSCFVSTTSFALVSTPLFPNDSLDGWHIVGPKITFDMQDGVLSGEGNEKRNAFLTSDASYSDFYMKVDVKIIRGNSGIQVRSHDVDNRLVGYQIEADPSERAWSGGLYDEGRRAWLQPPNENVRDTFKVGEWNTYEIWCIGPRIKAKVNGEITTNFLDFMDLSGHIGFQIHSGNSKVLWRNATITEYKTTLQTPLKSIPLFDSKTLNGMDPVGGGTWNVKDGEIVGVQSADDEVTGLMWIKQPYDEFALTLKYKIDKGNSGFFFRSQQIPNDNTGVRGIQVEVDRQTDCGGLYESGGRGWLSMPTEQFSNYDEWNEMMIFAQGNQVMVWINNKLVVDCDTSPQIEKQKSEGYTSNFAFQLHKRQDVEVRFKDIQIMTPTYVDGNGTLTGQFISCDQFH